MEALFIYQSIWKYICGGGNHNFQVGFFFGVWFVWCFFKEYHINIQSHLKFSYIELPGWLNCAAAEEINLPTSILNKKLGARMKNSDCVAVVW